MILRQISDLAPAEGIQADIQSQRVFRRKRKKSWQNKTVQHVWGGNSRECTVATYRGRECRVATNRGVGRKRVQGGNLHRSTEEEIAGWQTIQE